MIIDGITYIDNTVSHAVTGCGLQTTLRHVHGLTTTDEVAHLLSGTAGHAGLAVLFKLMGSNAHLAPHELVDAACTEFETGYREWAEANVALDDYGEDHRLSWNNTSKIFREWCTRVTEQYTLPFRTPTPELVEIGFAYPLDETGTRIFYGRMDVFAQLIDDLSWVVVDHKFTGRVDSWWVRAWKANSQVTGYIWAAQQHRPEIRGMLINAIELSRLPGSDRKCNKHNMLYSQCQLAHVNSQIIGPVTRTPEQLERWRLDMIAICDRYTYLTNTFGRRLEDVLGVRAEGPFTDACRWCQYYDWCWSVNRNVQVLPSLFVVDFWRPYDPREFMPKV